MSRKRNTTTVALSSNAPETEIRLQELQKLYLADRTNKKVFEELFTLIRTYARSLVLKKIKTKGIYLPPERVDEISTDATLMLVSQYEKEDWSIGVSFGGVLKWKIMGAMYEHAEEEQTISLNTKFDSDDNDSKEFIDIVGTNSAVPWETNLDPFRDLSTNTTEEIISSINVAFEEVKDIINFAYENLPYSTFIRFVPWLVLNFRKSKTRNAMNSFNKIFLSNKEENAFDILLLEIRNKIAGDT